MSVSWSEKVAVITGGESGIGKAVAAALATHGMHVVLAGLNREQGAATVAELAGQSGQVQFIETDVRHEAAVQRLFEQVASRWGGLDFLFNNAGIEGVLGPLSTNTEADIDQLLATNVKGVLLCAKQALPLLRKRGGSIVNTASFVGTVVPFPKSIAYGASKAAVISLTQSLAAAEPQVRIYAVCPWLTETPMLARLTGERPDKRARFAAVNPSGQFVSPAEVAAVVLELFAGTAEFQTGDAVLVDSGLVQKIQPMSPCAVRSGPLSSVPRALESPESHVQDSAR